MVHNTCRYCGNRTVMIKDSKSGHWSACTVGTRRRHRCRHWRTIDADADTGRKSRQDTLEEQLARAADDGWPPR